MKCFPVLTGGKAIFIGENTNKKMQSRNSPFLIAIKQLEYVP